MRAKECTLTTGPKIPETADMCTLQNPTMKGAYYNLQSLLCFPFFMLFNRSLQECNLVRFLLAVAGRWAGLQSSLTLCCKFLMCLLPMFLRQCGKCRQLTAKLPQWSRQLVSSWETSKSCSLCKPLPVKPVSTVNVAPPLFCFTNPTLSQHTWKYRVCSRPVICLLSLEGVTLLLLRRLKGAARLNHWHQFLKVFLDASRGIWAVPTEPESHKSSEFVCKWW